MENNSQNNNSTTIPDFNKPVSDTKESETVVHTKVISETIPKKKESNFLTFFYIFLTIILLITGYFVYYFANQFLNSDVSATEQKLVFENPLVRATKSRVISLEEGASKEAVRNIITQALLYEKVAPGEISIIMPSYLRDTVVDGTRKLVSELQRGDDFFFTFAGRAPLNLRTISAEKYAVGVVGNKNGKQNFLTFSVSSAPDANREMLRYETEIYNDLRTLLQLREIKGNLSFKDLSENNHILRVAYDDDGVLLVYGFGASKTIIVGPDLETFQNIFDNLK